jgi:hypothetical protein
MTSIRTVPSEGREKFGTWKRGGRATVLSPDAAAKGHFRDESVKRLTPDDVVERRWARLRTQHSDAGRGREFEQLKPYLRGDEPTTSYRVVDADLGLTETTVETHVRCVSGSEPRSGTRSPRRLPIRTTWTTGCGTCWECRRHRRGGAARNTPSAIRLSTRVPTP